ncbi:hypothetical protein JOB18_017618 [Solea senegalensis]|uniref:Uncharacterized protein n=1 Tax=Solea senegalensis TaxID=28829 RepID=A0AAV6QB61_SOLSE|nr:hypothetical protein JOB18_017618 [Solea senegalensis]
MLPEDDTQTPDALPPPVPQRGVMKSRVNVVNMPGNHRPALKVSHYTTVCVHIWTDAGALVVVAPCDMIDLDCHRAQLGVTARLRIKDYIVSRGMLPTEAAMIFANFLAAGGIGSRGLVTASQLGNGENKEKSRRRVPRRRRAHGFKKDRDKDRDREPQWRGGGDGGRGCQAEDGGSRSKIERDAATRCGRSPWQQRRPGKKEAITEHETKDDLQGYASNRPTDLHSPLTPWCEGWVPGCVLGLSESSDEVSRAR